MATTPSPAFIVNALALALRVMVRAATEPRLYPVAAVYLNQAQRAADVQRRQIR